MFEISREAKQAAWSSTVEKKHLIAVSSSLEQIRVSAVHGTSNSVSVFPPPLMSTLFYSLAAADVAVGCPFGGEERGGRVLIFNGNRDVAARSLTLSQELRATGTPRGSLPGFGFTLRGGYDLDANQYPGKHTLTTPPR